MSQVHAAGSLSGGHGTPKEDSADDTASPDVQPDEEESHRQLEQDLKLAPNP